MNWQHSELALLRILPKRLEREAISLPPSSRIGFACSGGMDSVFALLAFRKKLAEAGHCLFVLHFNHRTRGDENREDEAFVGELADSLGLPFVCGVRNAEGPPASNAEALLRQERIAFFQSTGMSFIITGHHQDDVLENLLMRLARGSGLEGLCGIRPVSVVGSQTYIRPLLGFSRQEIRELMEKAGAFWREDTSNASEKHLRNRIRHSVVPALAKATQRNCQAAAEQTRRQLQEDADALEAWFSGLHIPCHLETLERSRLQGLPRALWRRSLSQWLSEHDLRNRIRHSAVEALLDAFIEGRSHEVRLSPGDSSGPESWVVTVTPSALCFQKSPPAQRSFDTCWIGSGTTLYLPHRQAIHCEILILDSDTSHRIASGIGSDDASFVYLDAQSAGPRVGIRRYRAGDRFTPLGHSTTRKLKDCFVDRKISSEERSLLPVVIKQDETLLWSPGLPPAENCRIKISTKSAIKLTFFRH